jgi:hypothetical protein
LTRKRKLFMIKLIVVYTTNVYVNIVTAIIVYAYLLSLDKISQKKAESEKKEGI